jgi:sarcosine oxidase subunit beta
VTVVTDVVVIGAGIIGSSTAFHLAKLGKRVIVIDKSSVASGMTKRSGALVRSFFPHASLARLAHASIRVYQDWKNVVGGECGYKASGLVIVPDNVERLNQNIARLDRIGIDARVLSAAQLREIEPSARVDDIPLAGYDPNAGFIDPVVATQSWVSRAKALGAKFQTGVLVRKIRTERNRVAAVETTTGEIQTTEVVVAAGIWSDRLLRPLGAEIGIQTERHQVAFFNRPEELRAGHAAFWDAASGVYFRPHSYGLTMGGLMAERIEPGSPDQLDENVTAEFIRAVHGKIAARMPAMSKASFLRGHAGYYDSTADGLPVLGRAPGYAGLILAAGFGDAGLCVAPAAGACLAELIYDGETRSADLSAFGLGRFRERGISK